MINYSQHNKIRISLNVAIPFIQSQEGYKKYPYLDSKGVPTIGYGTTDPKVIEKYKTTGISVEKATEELERHITCRMVTSTIQTCIKPEVLKELKPNQIAALISFIYNIGSKAFKNSTLLKVINANHNDKAKITKEFNRWCYITTKGGAKRLAGLANRRQAEADLYFKV